MFLENLVNVFDKIYDRYANKFFKLKNLNVYSKKVNSIFKEVEKQKGDFNYTYTIAMKAQELIEEYLAFRS